MRKPLLGTTHLFAPSSLSDAGREVEMNADVLFVCTGNICRSPLAAALLRKSRPRLRISSAGLAALEGQPMDPLSRAQAVARGAAPDHLARDWSIEEAVDTALIVTMTRAQRTQILEDAPLLLRRTFTLMELVGSIASIAAPTTASRVARHAAEHRSALSASADVPDPYLQSAAVHDHVASMIDGAVRSLAAHLV